MPVLKFVSGYRGIYYYYYYYYYYILLYILLQKAVDEALVDAAMNQWVR